VFGEIVIMMMLLGLIFFMRGFICFFGGDFFVYRA
jgi:hypothetical protein